jgi:hypothetical protein
MELTRRAGSHYIIGYGGTVKIAIIDIIWSERNIVGNLVGYNLVELWALAGQGRVQLYTRTDALDAVNLAMNDWATDGDLDAAFRAVRARVELLATEVTGSPGTTTASTWTPASGSGCLSTPPARPPGLGKPPVMHPDPQGLNGAGGQYGTVVSSTAPP